MELNQKHTHNLKGEPIIMGSLNISLPESECSQRCQSTQHGGALTSAISLRGISSSVAISYIRWLCGNCGHVADTFGRSALHLAASCGCRDVATWLVRQCNANVNLRDIESGYTPLHRSVFYGQIHVAISLIQLGSSVSCLDYDDLTALDHAMKDRMPHVEFNLSNPCEVYTWGTNNNYTLGIGNQRDRSVPEIVDFFRKQNISIKQVAMHKFHSVFVAHDGRVFSCGHGQGGRLGLGNEKAALLPGQIKLTPTVVGTDAHVVAASVGRDHTVLLTEGGTVWTCGLNMHHQLGHQPPPPNLPTPRAMIPRVLRGLGTLQGVCAGRFHTIIWSNKGVMTCGLHAGQLGYPKGPEATQILPRSVTSLSQKEIHITHVATSDGATVVVTQKGDIYTLHEYQCRKIATRLLDIVRVVVVGGHLDSRVDTNVLMDRGGNLLKVAILTSTGKLLLWQESSQQMLRCMFSLNRPLTVTDVALSRGSTVLLTTRDGEAFEGELRARKPKKQVQQTPPNATAPAFHEFLERSDCEQVKVKRLLHIHRAVCVNCDPKGRNFAIVQTHPQAALLAVPVIETSEMREQMKTLLQDACTQDTIHDVVFVVGQREFPAHRFVVASQSEPLAKLMESKIVDSTMIPCIKVNNVKGDVFEQILLYIYTGECELLKPGVCCLKNSSNESKENREKYPISAYEVYSKENNNKKVKNKQTQKKTISDPVQTLQDTARRFGLVSLQKKLEQVKYENGLIVTKSERSIQPTDINFDSKHHQDLYDVTIQCDDAKEVKAHKCMLIARSEYFNSMLNHGWLESSQSSVLRLPIPQKVLELLMEFLYKNDSPFVRESEDLDLVCNVLVVADQLFVARLKEICEVTLAGMITLRNVAVVLQFSDTYNASQLKQCCMQYICLNLNAVLEIRGLESVHDSVLEELSKYYQDFNPAMSKRVITPYSDAPSQSLVEAVANAFPVSQDQDDCDLIEFSSKKNVKTLKKKPRIRKTSVNDSNKTTERTRNESLSSNHSVNSDEDGKRSLSFSDLTEKISDDVTLELRKLEMTNKEPGSPEKWVKVTSNATKHQKIIQARLRAIVSVKENPSELQEHDVVFTNISSLLQHIPESVPLSTQHPQLATSSQSPPTHAIPVPASPPNLISDFPELNSPPSSSSLHDSHHKSNHKTLEMKSINKISQKQRKKMVAEMTEQVEKVNRTTQFSWNLPNEHSHNSLFDIMREEAHHNRPVTAPIPVESPTHVSESKPESPPSSNPWLKLKASPVGSPETTVKFCDIIADEKKQRENWTKMRTKPLELTQLEDKAIEDLLVFYNAAGVSDERITVRRVITGAVAPPTWITSHH